MRVAILDVSPLTAWTVCRLLPPETDVVVFSAMEQAEFALRDHPPDAFLIGLRAGHISWEPLLERCRSCGVPYLLYYSLHVLPAGENLPGAVEAAAISSVEIGKLRETLHAFLKQGDGTSE